MERRRLWAEDRTFKINNKARAVYRVIGSVVRRDLFSSFYNKGQWPEFGGYAFNFRHKHNRWAFHKTHILFSVFK